MDADEAAARLRAADPAAGVEGTWTGPPAGRKTHARRWVPALAAAVVVAAVAAGAFALHDRSETPVAGPDSSVPSSATPTTGSASVDKPRVRAEALLAEVLTNAPVLPGATHVDAPPVSDHRFPGTITGSQYRLASSSSYWTAPGTADEAIAYFRTHQPAGLSSGGTMSMSNSKHAGGTGQAVFFDHPDTAFATDVELQLSVVPFQGGIAVRAAAQGVWVPERPASTKIPAVSEVDVVVTRDTDGMTSRPGYGAPTVRRSLSGTDAAAAAAAVNQLSVPFGPRMCTMAVGDFNDTLTFHTASGDYAVKVLLTGCSVATIAPPRTRPVSYEPGDVNATLMQILGLPKNYGLH